MENSFTRIVYRRDSDGHIILDQRAHSSDVPFYREYREFDSSRNSVIIIITTKRDLIPERIFRRKLFPVFLSLFVFDLTRRTEHFETNCFFTHIRCTTVPQVRESHYMT